MAVTRYRATHRAGGHTAHGHELGRRVVVLALALAVPCAAVAFACLPSDVDPAPLAARSRAGPSVAEAPVERGGAAVVDAAGGVREAPRSAVEVPVAADTSAEVEDPRITGWVAALHDDDVPGNALDAWYRLRTLPPGRVAALELALGSRDEQQRVFAAAVLRDRCAARRATPSLALLDASVDSLRSDVSANVAGTSAHPLRRTALAFLVQHAASAGPSLRRALGSHDAQQRFFAAFALAPVADADDAPHLVRELAPHLADNRIAGDALMACHALYRLGTPGLPALRGWRQHVDAQARSLIDLIEADLVAPPRDVATLRARGRTARISTLYHDAVIEFDLERSELPRL